MGSGAEYFVFTGMICNINHHAAAFTATSKTKDADDEGNGTFDRTRKDSFYWYQKVIASNGEDLG